MTLQLILITAGVLTALLGVILSFAWRVVVPTNKVYIVQSGKKTTSYGSGLDAGNVYYAIPSFIPLFGVTSIELPVNNFSLDLNDYRAYDKDRVPFLIHITAFFRISDTNTAALRVSNFKELNTQLEQIVKGAVRKILASHDIHKIMTDRATFGTEFTKEVQEELKNWGVLAVKSMELMDIKDDGESKVIANIMAQKSSHIEMESRIAVAENKQKGESAEIEARRAIELSNIEAKRTTELSVIEAKQIIDIKSAEQQQIVGIAKEKAQQEIKAQAVITTQREMEIKSVQVQREAEIVRAAAEVRAQQDKAVLVTNEQAKVEQSRLKAQGVEAEAKGQLQATLNAAEGIQKTGEAKAAAEKALQLAPVEAQIVLAKEIGENASYQQYLVTVRQIEATQVIGTAQAAALEKADIKVIANTGNAAQGLGSIGEILSSKGGQQVGAFLEGLVNTDEGKKVLDKVTSSSLPLVRPRN